MLILQHICFVSLRTQREGEGREGTREGTRDKGKR